jgi:hypothetical protein
MNPNLCRIVLRERSPFDVLDLAFRLIRSRFWPLARLSAVVLLPPWLVLAFLCWMFSGHWAIAVIACAIAPIAQAPYTVLFGRMLFSDEVRLREVLFDVIRAMPTLVAMSAVGVAGAMVAAVVSCGAFLPLVQGALMYAMEAALLERVGVERGLRRSWRLGFGHAGITTIGVLAFWVLTAWLAIVAEAAGQAVVDKILMLGTPFGSAVALQTTPWLVGGMLLAQPLYAVYRLLLYVDVRTRVEGWDLQVALRAAGLPR